MVMLNDGNWIKTAEVNEGDKVQFKDEGVWQESAFTYDDGKPKNDFVITVLHNGEDKNMRLNKKNRTTIIDVYGKDTSKWVGKVAEITKKFIEVAGKDTEVIRLKAKPEDQGEAEPELDIPY